MTDKLRHWSALSKTDPKHTKEFKRAGGFSGTAIKPIYAVQKMTEHFGPCGLAWGMEEPKFQVIEAAGETLVYCTVAAWYDEGKGPTRALVYGVGGDKVTAKRKDGTLAGDDEAFKKAYTDALTNALVKIGVSADVHMGMFEDNKYVSALKKEFAEEESGAPSQPPQRSPEDDLKAKAEALARELKTADTLFKLDTRMEEARPLLKQLPQKTYDYLGKLYEQRREAMETAS